MLLHRSQVELHLTRAQSAAAFVPALLLRLRLVPRPTELVVNDSAKDYTKTTTSLIGVRGEVTFHCEETEIRPIMMSRSASTSR